MASSPDAVHVAAVQAGDLVSLQQICDEVFRVSGVLKTRAALKKAMERARIPAVPTTPGVREALRRRGVFDTKFMVSVQALPRIHSRRSLLCY